jgi:hypothetical protein
MFKFFKFCKIGTLVLVGVGIAAIVGVQGLGTARAGSATMPELGAFEALSRGDKKIAEALFDGQMVTENGSEPLSLDLIAASKQRSGWGRIFKQLKADGLIDAKNLRELASGRYQRRTAGKSLKPAHTTRATVVTTASGRQIIVGKKSLARHSRLNRSRDKNRRDSQNIGKHADGVFDAGSTYRGRSNNGLNGSAPSIGITSGKGVATTNITAN